MNNLDRKIEILENAISMLKNGIMNEPSLVEVKNLAVELVRLSNKLIELRAERPLSGIELELANLFNGE